MDEVSPHGRGGAQSSGTDPSGVRLVKRDTVPPIREVEVDGVMRAIGEVRNLSDCEELRDFVPTRDFSVSWANLEAGGTHDVHVHPIQSMMVVCSGSGDLIGELRRPIRFGDVIVVPAGCEHGFTAGPHGLGALSIQFGDALYSADGRPRAQFADASEATLESLRAYGESRRARIASHPIFDTMSNGTASAAVRRRVAEHLRCWGETVIRMAYRRVATSGDCDFGRLFRRQAQRDVAVAEQLTVTASTLLEPSLHQPGLSGQAEPEDAVLRAAADWFVHQMFLLDAAEKLALTHWIVGTVNDAYLRASGVKQTLVAGDDYDSEQTFDLLRHQTSQTYTSIQGLLGEACDMWVTLVDRVLENDL